MSGLFGGGPPFEDRRDAGRQLARRLAGYRSEEEVVVFALPRGGVPVAFEVAASLDAPLDVIVARKLGAPDQPELGIGAVAQGGERIVNESAVAHLGISEEYIESVTRRETEVVESAVRRFRGGREEMEVRSKTAILVDDGLATGVTARVAIHALREREPRKVVLAVPVCAPRTSEALRREVDDVVCLESPEDLGAIGFWYRNFEQTSDETVIELLAESRRLSDGNDTDSR